MRRPSLSPATCSRAAASARLISGRPNARRLLSALGAGRARLQTSSGHVTLAGTSAAGAGGTAAGAKRAKIDFRSAILALLQGRAPGKTC